MANQMEQWIVFGCDDEQFGIPILDIYEIVFVPEITPVANTEKFNLGLINLRGSVITVYDLRGMLGKNPGSLTKKQRVLVTRCGDQIVGLLVDYVSQVLKVSTTDLEAPPETIARARHNYIDQVYKQGAGIISKFNLHHLLLSLSHR